MPRTKAVDEIFCRSCGEPIKEEAEICPECGVRNKQEKSSQTSSPPSASVKHDPSQYETTVSDTWYYGIAAGAGLWILLLAIASATGSESAFLGLIVLVAWVLIPVATYFDAKYVRANSQWNPNTVVWCIAGAIWLINIVSAAAYLYRRHEALGEP
ncbi:zinc ribbon domain-containing protein [Halosolutus gelatinilyticus]|uniref:zinc ribbon domain-containing protein n=1 Tax=Halosolutus gelatinilyticus TaxID=2931975 RepID=UPI001FF3E59E|nr:zinc ribbon domain-containing protein [Halosolutus gelatinilyticus]